MNTLYFIKRNNWNRGFTSVYLISSRIKSLCYYQNMLYSDNFIHEIYVGDIINVTVPDFFFINNAFVGCPSQTYCLIFRLKYDEIWIFSNLWKF